MTKITIDNGLGAEIGKRLRGEGIYVHRDIKGLEHTVSEECPCHPLFVREDDTRTGREIADEVKPLVN